MRTRTAFQVLLLAIACTWPHAAARSQTPPAPETGRAATPHAPDGGQIPVFRARSELVVLHVNVFDGHSEAVSQLPQSAFQVFEDGVPRQIEHFTAGVVPVAVGLVIDNSTSMLTRQAMVRAAVRTFAASSRDGDELFTVVFNEHVRRGLPDGVPFTRHRHLLEASLARYPIGGKTALYDAVIDGLGHLAEAANQKRVLVVLSDGEDNASKQSESNMMYRARRSDALIYTIWTGDLAGGSGNPRLLRRLAQGNGGVAYRPDSEKEVVEHFTAIADNIRRGYSLGFVPAAPADGRYHRIRVDVRHEGRSYQVRVRDGYMAPDATPE